MESFVLVLIFITVAQAVCRELGQRSSRQQTSWLEAEAYEHYSAMKSRGEVKVVRVTTVEDEHFGSIDEAME